MLSKYIIIVIDFLDKCVKIVGTQEVLKNINSYLCNMWPTGKNPILYDCDKKIIWTYHPNYLNRSHLKEESLNKIKKIVR